MEKGIHKGTELNNVKETWDQNERGDKDVRSEEPKTDIDKVVKEEAAEYDAANKEERVLGGDRATLNDDESDQ